MSGPNPLAESHKNLTIKKILHEMERDLIQVEEENYQIVKEQAEQRMLKANPKLAMQKQKQLEREMSLMQQSPGSPNKGATLKSINSQLTSEKQKITSKKLIKDVQNDQFQVLNGQFKPTIKLNKFEDEDKDKEKPVYTYQQHRLFLKKNGVTYFEKYEPPKKESDQLNALNQEELQLKEQQEQKAKQQATLDAMNSISLQRNFSLPSLNDKKGKKGKMQSMKQEQDQMIFNEVFIQPRAQQLSQIIHKHNQQQKILIQSSLSLSQKIGSNGQLPPLQSSGFNVERVTTAQKIQDRKSQFLENKDQRLNNDKSKLELSALLQSKRLMEQSEKIFDQELKTMNGGQRLSTAYSNLSELDQSIMLDEQDPLAQGDSNHADDIVKIVMRKFNSSAKLQNSSSFFTQQIQVQPPEGLINSIGNNIKDASWAPSIPISTAFLKQSSLKVITEINYIKDITLRAKAGVQAGDIQKEAHMAFALGNLNEQEKNYKKSIKFYKRFFFCARILEDPVGASLGLNRLGVMYHKLKNYGISHRLLRNFEESIRFFQQALEWSQQHQEFESECISNGQLGVTFLIIKQNDQAKIHFEDAQALNDKELAEQCMCNMGIAMGNLQVKNMKRNFSVEILRKVQVEEEEDEDE